MSTSAPGWLPNNLILLDERCPLPLDRPFLATQAPGLGVSRWHFSVLVKRALVREVVRGVYVAAQVPDSVELRARALSLVVPERKVVTDRTAAWLHGVDILPRSAVLEAPPVQAFDRATSRIRRPGVASGIRTLSDADVMVVDGVQVTTPLRTALDLGRLLRSRYDAIAALDAFLRFGVSPEHLQSSVERFRGERGVIQLRSLVPLADPRAESPPESALRLVWIDCGLPTPEPQCWVYDKDGRPIFRIDVGLPALRFGAEYQGERFHSTPEARERDAARLGWLDDEGWTIVEFWKGDLYAPTAEPERMLHEGMRRARRRLGSWNLPGETA